MFLQQWQSEQGHRTERRRMMRMLPGRAEEKEGQAKRRRHVGGVKAAFWKPVEGFCSGGGAAYPLNGTASPASGVHRGAEIRA